MRIALIAEHTGSESAAAAGPYPGDPAARVLSLATGLAELDHQVTVYSRKTSAGRRRGAGHGGVDSELIVAGPQEKVSSDKLLPHIGTFAGQLAERWRANPPDLAHAHGWIAGLAALGAARDLGIPVVQTFSSPGPAGSRRHGQPARDRSDRARLEAGIGRTAAAVLAETSDQLAALIRRGVPQAAIKVVPAGVDTSRFCPRGPVADRAGRPRVLMFASLAERQLIATVLAALARVPDAELVIAGGPARSQLPNVPGYRDAIKLAQRLRLEHRLTLLGQLSQDDAPALMRSADVLVSLAADEPFAMTPVHAMACGIPVIATAAGAQRDAVIHGTTGLIVAPTDPELLAGRLRQLLAAPMQREGYGIAAASRAKARYSWDRIARETVAVYETLARTSAAAAAAA